MYRSDVRLPTHRAWSGSAVGSPLRFGRAERPGHGLRALLLAERQ